MYNLENIKKSAIYELLAKLSDKTPNGVKRYFNRNKMDALNTDDVIKYIETKRHSRSYYDSRQKKMYYVTGQNPSKKLIELSKIDVELGKSIELKMVEFNSAYSI